jgi:RNA polymerase sigma-70 factor (ECF subfamily)
MSKLDQAREIQLAERIRNGDAEAFEEFAVAFGRRLLHYSLLICRQREDAEEVVQDTLLKLHGHIGELRETTRLRPWAFRIARNVCLMKRRGANKTAPREVSIDPHVETSFLSRCMENGATIRQFYAAVAHLPEEQLMVFLLRTVEGMTTGETAEVIGISEEAVKGRLKRARQAIHEELAGRVV